MWRRRSLAQVGRQLSVPPSSFSHNAQGRQHGVAATLHSRQPIVSLLFPTAAGFKVTKREMTATQFYFRWA